MENHHNRISVKNLSNNYLQSERDLESHRQISQIKEVQYRVSYGETPQFSFLCNYSNNPVEFWLIRYLLLKKSSQVTFQIIEASSKNNILMTCNVSLLKYDSLGTEELLNTAYRFLHQYVNLAREQERRFTTARAVQMPKYGQSRTESRLLRAPSRHHLTFPFRC